MFYLTRHSTHVIYSYMVSYIIMQRCQLVRFTRKSYRSLRFARAYGHTMQSSRIFMIFADSYLQSFRFIFELLSVCNDASYAS